jgi:hypothetical protein
MDASFTKFFMSDPEYPERKKKHARQEKFQTLTPFRSPIKT